jgi:hypothetical protein
LDGVILLCIVRDPALLSRSRPSEKFYKTPERRIFNSELALSIAIERSEAEERLMEMPAAFERAPSS